MTNHGYEKHFGNNEADELSLKGIDDALKRVSAAESTIKRQTDEYNNLIAIIEKQKTDIENFRIQIFSIMALFFGIFAFISIDFNFTRSVFSYSKDVQFVDPILLVIIFILLQFIFFIFIRYFLISPFLPKNINGEKPNRAIRSHNSRNIAMVLVVLAVIVILLIYGHFYQLYEIHKIKEALP
ncbi:MAG: hypothetical protein LBQ34_06160 [Alphaproteobacteria bacterium]|jgi:fatty acid desaturase|nr:hypothetical protein [Alphaproteobacteria bacterium]